MKIAHLADIHIRFSSRHDEYRAVFERLFKDLKSQKPNRIVIVGDLNHQKINMSPGSLDLSAEFLINLAKIAPVDIFMGNHDMNASQKEQGDTITPMFTIVERFSDLLSPTLKAKLNKSFIVTKDNADKIDFSNKALYFFPNSEFYKINENLVYGVYSCKDNETITLTKKEENVNYIAFYHGKVYGARGDNGYELFGNDLVNPTTFNNFDIVMLGDIHEHQTFRDDDSMAYCGSLVQQDYGESIDKGYLLWDVENKTFQRRFILNDYGFAKITIAKGESIEERVDNIKFSNDKKKTKVNIVWEDFEENFSTEKEAQIARLVKEKYGCEVVKVNFSALEKEEKTNTDVEDAKNQETFIEQLVQFVKDVENDFTDEMIKELVDFAKHIDQELEIQEKPTEVKIWDVEGFEVSNIFSFGEKPIKIPIDKYRGLTGIFGKNYSGKSNTIKALIWALYQHILGGGDPKKLVNIYTSSNKGWTKTYLIIDGERYRIFRQVETTKDKKGKSSNSYSVAYEKQITDENGKEKWVPEISDEKKANKLIEVKKIVEESIGTFEDFTKVSFQSQDGEGSYLSQKQQDKNDLINRYMGLEFFRDRYDYGNSFVKDIKKKRKAFGDVAKIEGDIVEVKAKISSLETEIGGLETSKKDSETKKDEVDAKILEITGSLKRSEALLPGEYANEKDVNDKMQEVSVLISNLTTQKSDTEIWLSTNFKKELPFAEGVTFESLNQQFNQEDVAFQSEKKQYLQLENWLKLNPKKEELNTAGYDQLIQTLNTEIANLNAKIPTYKGEKCPTCGHVTKQANPELLQDCMNEISEKTGLMNSYSNAITSSREIAQHNLSVDTQTVKLSSLKNTLLTRKNNKDSLKKSMDLFLASENIISHNNLVESKTAELNNIRNQIEDNNRKMEKLQQNLTKLSNIRDAEKFNEQLNKDLEYYGDQSKGYKFTIYDLGQKILQKTGDLRIEKNNLENYETKFKEIAEEERKFKIYSVYLQAVHRDGIPARIIRKKLPIVNNKLNSILNSTVNFQIEMKVQPDGDIVEEFYFSEDKSDMLPLSSASGSQKFIASLVIKDALHYISNLIKPSINIIDEGFGTLDDELTAGIVNVLYYLKNKHKNVLIITHRNEIKDFVDNIIECYKDTSDIPQEILDKNPDAGITKLNVI